MKNMNLEIVRFLKKKIEEDLVKFREGNPNLIMNNPILEYIFLNEIYDSIVKIEENFVKEDIERKERRKN